MDTTIVEAIRGEWLDRVWALLFPAGDGLLSPRQIVAEGLDRQQVRVAELAAIDSAEREGTLVRSGRLLRDVSGQLVDTAAVDVIPMFSVIEQTPVDAERLLAGIGQPAQVLHAAAEEASRRDLVAAFNLRRIAILAETVVLACERRQVLPAQRPGSSWMQQWRSLAGYCSDAGLQQLWARVLAFEIAAPGRYPPALLDTLARIDPKELPAIRLLASYSFREFIFDARGSYFDPDLHGELVRIASRLGLLRAEGRPAWLQLTRQRLREDPQLLICNNRALQIRALPNAGVKVPVIRITDIGKQLLRLCDASADLAYLADMAAYLKAQGAELSLGDWTARERRFAGRLQIG